MNIKEITDQEREQKRAERAKTPLNVIDPVDAAICCGKHFRKAEREKRLTGGTWECPKCGLEWHRVPQTSPEGVTLVFWHAIVRFEVMR